MHRHAFENYSPSIRRRFPVSYRRHVRDIGPGLASNRFKQRALVRLLIKMTLARRQFGVYTYNFYSFFIAQFVFLPLGYHTSRDILEQRETIYATFFSTHVRNLSPYQCIHASRWPLDSLRLMRIKDDAEAMRLPHLHSI